MTAFEPSHEAHRHKEVFRHVHAVWPTDARNPVTNRLHGETLVDEIAASRAAPRTTPDRLITASTARSK
jgi:hypothetical protein